MISDERVEQAMRYLSKTDLPAAEAKSKAKALEAYGKTAKAFGFLEASGTVAEREAQSVITSHYTEYLENYEKAVLASEHFANKRATEAGVREVWRSLQANRRQGA